MQEPMAVASRSVGEKLSPRPWLSTGASVTSQLDQYNLSDAAGGGRGNNSPWTNPQVMERMRQQSPITNASMKACMVFLLAFRYLTNWVIPPS